LDERLNKTITTEEYTSKKQKILNQKIENEEKLSVFERKGNRWLEPLQNFIIAAHQAQTAGLQRNFSEKKNFLKRIGSNPLLQNRQIVLIAKKPWELLAETNDVAEGEPRSGEGATSKKEKNTNWLWVSVAHLAVRGIVRGFGGFFQRPVDAPRSGFQTTVMEHFCLLFHSRFWENGTV
jgi:hypothetical protein